MREICFFIHHESTPNLASVLPSLLHESFSQMTRRLSRILAQIKPWVPLSNKKLRTIDLSSAKARAESFFIRELNGAREKNGLWMGLVHFFIREDSTPNYNSTLLSL